MRVGNGRTTAINCAVQILVVFLYRFYKHAKSLLVSVRCECNGNARRKWRGGVFPGEVLVVSSFVESLLFDPPAWSLDHLHLGVVHRHSGIAVGKAGAVRPHGAREDVRRRDGEARGDKGDSEEGGHEGAALS